MMHIIAALDGSDYMQGVCELTAWVSKRAHIDVSLLHVADAHTETDHEQDLSGAIGLGAKAQLLEEYSRDDAAHGKQELAKGEAILQRAQQFISDAGIEHSELLHRRGSLEEAFQHYESQAEAFIIGKSGEDHHELGDHLESIARAVHKPLWIARKYFNAPTSFMIAYDGSDVAAKAIHHIAEHPLLKGLDCHIVTHGRKTPHVAEGQAASKALLEKAGFTVTCAIEDGRSVAHTLHNYAKANKIELLVAGAYGHSKITQFFVGSTTTTFLKELDIAMVLYH